MAVQTMQTVPYRYVHTACMCPVGVRAQSVCVEQVLMRRKRQTARKRPDSRMQRLRLRWSPCCCRNRRCRCRSHSRLNQRLQHRQSCRCQCLRQAPQVRAAMETSLILIRIATRWSSKTQKATTAEQAMSMPACMRGKAIQKIQTLSTGQSRVSFALVGIPSSKAGFMVVSRGVA